MGDVAVLRIPVARIAVVENDAERTGARVTSCRAGFAPSEAPGEQLRALPVPVGRRRVNRETKRVLAVAIVRRAAAETVAHVEPESACKRCDLLDDSTVATLAGEAWKRSEPLARRERNDSASSGSPVALRDLEDAVDVSVRVVVGEECTAPVGAPLARR